MSGCGQTEEESASEEAGRPSRADYEEKAVSKVVRVLTVLAYLLSVSLAAILLSVYYVCVWKSPTLPHVNETIMSAQIGDPLLYDDIGGGNTTMNETFTQPSNSSYATSEAPDSTSPTNMLLNTTDTYPNNRTSAVYNTNDTDTIT